MLQDRLSCFSCLDIFWGEGEGRGRVFQHDNAPVHTALLTENVLHTNDIYVIE